MRTTSLQDILTDQEIARARVLRTKPDFHKKLLKELIEPNIERINKALGQENIPDYIAYMVELMLTWRKE